jgi:hypothetical protein
VTGKYNFTPRFLLNESYLIFLTFSQRLPTYIRDPDAFLMNSDTRVFTTIRQSRILHLPQFPLSTSLSIPDEFPFTLNEEAGRIHNGVSKEWPEISSPPIRLAYNWIKTATHAKIRMSHTLRHWLIYSIQRAISMMIFSWTAMVAAPFMHNDLSKEVNEQDSLNNENRVSLPSEINASTSDHSTTNKLRPLQAFHTHAHLSLPDGRLV